MAEGQHEEREAYAVAEEADDTGGQHRPGRRQSRALEQRQNEIDRPRHQTLEHGGLHRVRRRELASEVVVNSPSQAGAGDHQRSEIDGNASPLPREERRPGQNSKRPQ
jgi:hypothetical protein